ncbi:putative pectinesterase/pectinesterase inhibitor 12 [Dorcoceras hygrometricum]|uniref:Pectinesterase n=1 Tax=Dorcoceras hygrometricum TaxID=472368 RepID=A0A2Z7A5P9_9LAMI|nr:putative pectinesterase/pectinesterase inhibitor 12 [Dorcoceras hygrometricum]
MASNILKFLIILSSIFLSAANSLQTPAISTAFSKSHLSSIKSFCKSTPFPDSCFHSLKLSLSITISPTTLAFVLQTLKSAISESLKLSVLISDAGNSNLIEKQKGTVQDCKELHQITLSSLKKSISRVVSSPDSRKLADARTFLSAALTNRITCLEGLNSAAGSLKPTLISSLSSAYEHVSNSLSMLSKPNSPSGGGARRRLLGYDPPWRILEDNEYDPRDVVTVAADGSGNFTAISDAVNFAPNNNGSDVTWITGNRSVADGWTTFRSATVAVSGQGFLARGISFENTAGPEKHQAVALRINADFSALYKCVILGFQDSLYVHSFRQFFRECDIFGTIDYIFGNAAAIFQGCSIISRKPLPGQYTVITAQSRDNPDENTGISLQNCSILATDDLYANSDVVRSYLGRPWRNYSRTVVLESYIDKFIEPDGWTQWDGDQGLDTLYYGEYENFGPGSDTSERVSWGGYRVMDYNDASNFTVSEFIAGDEWLTYTSFPFDDGV